MVEDAIVISDDEYESDDDIEMHDGRPMVAINIDENGEVAPVYEIERIIATRCYRGRRMFRVKWAGCPIAQASWKYEDELDGCQEAIFEYLSSDRRVKRRHHN